jgi:hypothetical protein
MISDTFVRRVLSPFLLILLLIFLIPVGVGGWIIARTDLLFGAEPEDAILLARWLREFAGIPGDSAGLIFGAMPILIAALVYRPGANQSLNWTGRLALLLTLLGAMVSALVVAYVDPLSPVQQGALTGGGKSLEAMEQGGIVSLRLMLSYLFLLIGINLPIEKTGGGK